MFLVLLAFLSIGLGLLFFVFFVPVIAFLVWRDQDRIVALEKRIAALENPQSKSESNK